MKNGVFTALVTPFKENGKIDFIALKKLVAAQIQAKVAGIIILGTTAESPTLSSREKKQIIEFVLPLVQNKAEIWVGCGTNCTSSTLRAIKKLNKYPINGILLSLPAYNKPNFWGLSLHIQKCCNASHHQIMLYNVPGRTGLTLSSKQLETLCQNKNIVAIKEASGDLKLFRSLVENTNIKIFSGNDPDLFHSLALGGSGIVSVASNAFPKEIVKITSLFFSRHKSAAAKKTKQLEPVFCSLFIETNPVPIKFVLCALGFCNSTVRLPLGELSQENKQTIFKNLSLLKNT